MSCPGVQCAFQHAITAGPMSTEGSDGYLPPPPLCVGPNFSHHKARVQAVGWFPFGDQETGQHTFCYLPPANRSGTEWVTDPTQPPQPLPPGTSFAPSLQVGTS